MTSSLNHIIATASPWQRLKIWKQAIIRKTPLKPGVVEAARRTVVLRAGELEISVEITAEARPLGTVRIVPR